MRRFLYSVLSAATLALAPIAVSAQTIGYVVSTGDGDTIRVAIEGKTVTVRLACIDAPETAQKPFGKSSAQQLKQLIPVGQAITLRVVNTDRYGRTVAEVFKNGSSVNLQMVEAGQAVAYRQYLNACSSTQDRYLQAEAQAKAQRLGVWNQENPVMPWDFRRSKHRKHSKVNVPVVRSNGSSSDVGIVSSLCYMQTADGRIIDLSWMCGKKSSYSTTTDSSSYVGNSSYSGG